MYPRQAGDLDDMRLGAHVSVAGGLARAPARGRSIGADVIQIFTRNQVQWRARGVGRAEAQEFRAAMARSGLTLAVSHGSYLVNLASPDRETLQRSRRAFVGELQRCAALDIPYVVFHPGAHMGAGTEAGIRRIVKSLDQALERTRDSDVMPLLEVTAGQGSSIGHRFEEIAEILSRVRRPERLGVCLDTCHLLAAGYDLASPRGYERTLEELAGRIGLPRVRFIHLNDARARLGSRLDRHAPIGQGHLGRQTFRRLLRDPRLREVPMALETPGPEPTWRREIALLRRLGRAPRPVPAHPRRGRPSPRRSHP
jgi:deoxyribonuclease IV